jgi:hypothetical protein
MEAMNRREGPSLWWLRAFFIVVGAAVSWAGFYGVFTGNLYYQTYSGRTGHFTTMGALGVAVVGLILIGIGLIRRRKSIR